MRKRVLSLVLSIIFSISAFSFAFAESVNEKKSELNEVNENIEEIKDKIEDVKDEKKDVLSDISAITEDMDKLQDEINDINTQVVNTKKQITKTNQELNQAIKEYEEEQKLHEERMRAIYINGPTGYLEVLFSSGSFSDFITRIDIVKKMMEYDKKVLMEFKEKQDEIATKKELLESDKNKMIALESNLASKKDKLSIASNAKSKELEKLKKDEIALEKMLDAEVEESKKLESEIRSLQSGNNGGSSYSGSKTGILRLSDIGYTPRITSPYGWRYHPILKKQKLHPALDIAIPSGTPVYAMSEGTVIISKYSNAYGNYVVIDHGGGLTTLYAHNSVRLVSVGQKVQKGQMITKSGNTGWSTGPHLHYEVRKNGATIDPNPYYIIGK